MSYKVSTSVSELCGTVYECLRTLWNSLGLSQNSVELSGTLIIFYKRIGYDLNVMQQSTCLVIYPITVDNFAVLYNCTPVDRASDSMMAPT